MNIRCAASLRPCTLPFLAVILWPGVVQGQVIDSHAIDISHNSGTITIYNGSTNVSASCPEVTSGVDDRSLRHLAALTAQDTANGTSAAWQASMDKLVGGLNAQSAASASRLNRIAARQETIVAELSDVRKQIQSLSQDEALERQRQSQNADNIVGKLAALDGQMNQVRQELAAQGLRNQDRIDTLTKEIADSFDKLRAELRGLFDEYLPTNPALRVVSQVGLRLPGPLVHLSGQISIAKEVGDDWSLGATVGGVFGLPIGEGVEGGFAGPDGTVLESIRFKEQVNAVELGPELRYLPTRRLRLWLQGLYRYSWLTWRDSARSTEFSHTTHGAFGRVGADVLIFGPLVLAMSLNLGYELDSQIPLNTYTGVLGETEVSTGGGRLVFEGGASIGFAFIR